MAHWMFKCKNVSQKISESLDCRLPLHQLLMIRMHLAMCRLCRRAYKQINCLREIARHSRLQEAGMDESVFLSPEACGRIKEFLRSQRPSP
jgi:hypothetical protein